MVYLNFSPVKNDFIRLNVLVLFCACFRWIFFAIGNFQNSTAKLTKFGQLMVPRTRLKLRKNTDFIVIIGMHGKHKKNRRKHFILSYYFIPDFSMFVCLADLKKATMMQKLAVVALGGNALLRDTETGTIEEQEHNTTETLENLVHLINDGYNLVITHGNGPQVGNILMRNDAGETLYNISPMPLDICVADSQGGIGYMIERMMRNVLNKHGIDKNILSVISMVTIDPKDEAFQNPTKRIGKTYNEADANLLHDQKGWQFKPSLKHQRAWRRVVPSPTPIDILNKGIIGHMVREGNIVITAGGGGIPVYLDEEKNVRTVDAVIDKDMTSALLASSIQADEFFILTDVPFIYKDFGLPSQEKLEFLDYADTLRHLHAGTFGEGSMAPKIRACLNFIENGGQKSVITEATKLEDKSYGSKITMYYDNQKLAE